MKIEDLPPIVAERAAHLLPSLQGLELPEPTGWHVLALQYVRPDKVGSLYVAEDTKREDRLQGRVGLVLAIGPLAYTKPELGHAWCEVGDWILWKPLASTVSRFEWGHYGADARTRVILLLLNDDEVICRGVAPELVMK
jgi:hypothetical protein